MGPCTGLLHAAARSRVVSWVPVRPPIAAVLHRHTLPCATFRSPHTAGGFHFVIGCCMASHCCCLPTHTLWLHTLWFWPRDCPNECEVCGDSKRSTALICMSY
ncbi:unnamed protein product [Staurois parvus]|uniref:Secreted protein n=1 Tax=Staurois parvus TaxID=386267 RepID=A0ABN9FEZ9_9NEOB|nr:unnamed protein product [Staurois parvus]